MGRKRSKPKTPRQKSDRKAKRAAKSAIQQHCNDENVADGTSTQVHSPPARDHVSVSVAVEQGEISTVSPPVPEQIHDHAAVEKGDFSTKSPPAPEPDPVSVVVEKGEFSTKSPSTPEQAPFSSAVEKGEIPVPGVDLDAAAIGAIPSLRRSQVPVLNNVATPALQSAHNGDKKQCYYTHTGDGLYSGNSKIHTLLCK